LLDFLHPSTEREPAILADEDAAHSGNLMEAAQLKTIRAVLQEHRGNISSTARALGISGGTLYSKLKLSRR
jgi:transcriptional regulator of acetoin/glycerol metabolism